MKVDAHQHFWKYSAKEYGWIGPDMAVLQQDRLPEDLAPLLAEAHLDGSVAVQARQTLAETEWLLDLAAQYPFIKGVVGWVDLCSLELPAQLERVCAHPRLCGIRHVVQDELDDQFMVRDDFLRGLAALARFDLAYDLLIFPRHLPVACQVVERFPHQRFVLDHIAKPLIRDRVMEPWAADIRRLAAYPNVVCKLSGMITEANWQSWELSHFQPYLDIILEVFGTRRLMFGSDWPVCTLAGPYSQVVSLVSAVTQQLSTEEQAEVWGGTARRFYGLE